MCDANYVTWKYRQHWRYHVIFARKHKSLQNVNILGARFNRSGAWHTTSHYEQKHLWIAPLSEYEHVL